jgi:histidine triad (HIT) family protein
MPSDCLFCRIVAGELGTEFVAENDYAVAFRDINPQAPVHLLVVPKQHVSALRDIGQLDDGALHGMLDLAVSVASAHGIDRGGYRLVTNDGADAGQTVFHLHWHLLGGEKLNTGFA